MTIEHLSSESIGIILSQLNLITGSEGILNEADIPVVMRSAMNLACTSKIMYQHVHSVGANRIFLLSLAAKYKKPPEYFAAELDTEGARRFLWDTIQKNGDKKNYEVIQAIYTLITHVKKEAKEAGLAIALSEEESDCPPPNPFYCKTQNGFFLFNDGGPSYLGTPFGKIALLGVGGRFSGCSGYAPFSVSELLIRRLGATFKGLTSSDFEGARCSILAVPPLATEAPDTIRKLSHNQVRPISKAKMERYKESQIVVETSVCGICSIYQINAINGEALPKAAWPEKEGDTHSHGTITKIWELLEIDSSGSDPCLKPRSRKRARPTCMTETASFSTSAEIIPWAISVVDRLKQQPAFSGTGSLLSQPTKVLVLENLSFARVVELLHKTSQAKGYITTFGLGNYQLDDEDGINLGQGIELSEDPSEIDLATLSTAYSSILSQIGSHWKFAQLKDYPSIRDIRSEEDYILLMKERPFFREEDTLIQVLASLTGISRFITCSDDWKEEGTPGIQKPRYLWIKKNKFSQVAAVLNLSPAS
ncbi:MAG: hypothetical protein KBC64_04630 [Simkaniaceae bacterium]|nr:hypothetical protein [Simkaniaceae bacterium]